MSSEPANGHSLARLAVTFVPSGLLLAAALLLPEVLTPGGTPNLHFLDGLEAPAARPIPPGTPQLPLLRLVLTIWLSTLLMIPAVSLYVLRGRSAERARVARLFWTFSYAAYLVHFYYAAFVVFGGVEGTFAHMRHWVAAVNFFLTGWWTLDVLVAWLGDPARTWVRLERTLAQGFIVVVYVATDLFLRPTFVRFFGVALAVAVVWCLLVRLARSGAAGSLARPEAARTGR
jgi:hypothetical protein